MKDAETLDTTIDEWRAEVHRLEKSSDINGLTITELMKSLDLTRWGANELVRQLTANMRCESGSSTRKDRTGRSYHVTVYQLTNSPNKRKKND